MNIIRHFLAAASQHPQQIAIVHNSKVISYDDLRSEVLKTVNAFKNKGIKPEDNVMVMIPFSIELYIHILAIFVLGANVVLVDEIKPKSRVTYTFDKANCKAIVTSKKLVVLKYFLFHSSLWNKITALKRTTKSVESAASKQTEDSALITFTSGTTGHPKAADRTHGFLDTQLNTLIEEMNITSSDTHVTSLPVVLMCNLAIGATSIIPPKYSNENHWKFIKENYPPNLLSASPAHFDHISKLIDCNKLNRVFIGGANILPHFAKDVARRVDIKKVTLVYGSTEAEPIATVSLSDYLESLFPNEKGLLVGKSHPNIQLKINTQGYSEIVELNDNEIGEIIVSGPHVLNKYYQDDEAFAKNKIVAKNTIWHKTGDAGFFKNGQLYYLGRMKYTWVVDGEWLAPITFEKHISVHQYKEEGTWLIIEGRHTVFIQKTINTNKILSSFNHNIDDIIYVSELPRDKRHLSRIDYEKLMSGHSN
jgi:acyl-CoA synthetase (AMP-forming)/AMP-acid ligase II